MPMTEEEMLALAKSLSQRPRYAEQYDAYNPTEPGNLNLQERPHVKNPDGSTSTVRSMSVNLDGKEYLLPTVSKDGRVMGDEEAIDEFRRTQEHLGVYPSVEDAERASVAIHEDQVKRPPLNVTIPRWIDWAPGNR